MGKAVRSVVILGEMWYGCQNCGSQGEMWYGCKNRGSLG